ncbi:MAG: flagellar hook-basal body protein [Lachnospiraceae bacterium]|nr:flagellar hook-basal body protein [Lachnospiraceae bacterium]MBR4994231.1 flagellar hook-basal body protein [Lachnospiraceae bacterium]MBR5944489.1 flagellar hook-basal body protein [Lachnospiraceae bacterium]
MLKGLYTAYTGLRNEQNRMDIMTNNLANSTTVGFKKEGSTSQSFDDILAFRLKDTSDVGVLPKRVGINNPGVKIGESYTNYDQGPFQTTGNTYDLALGGNGFFTIEFTNKAGVTSTKYTRAGDFTLTKDGYLVTKDGDYVLGTAGRIKLNPLVDATVNRDGSISQNGVTVATLRLTDFEDYDYLLKYGETYFEPVEGYKTKAADAEVYSGYLETANLSVVTEMVNMISITRAYESNQKIIQAYDQTLEYAANQTGKL